MTRREAIDCAHRHAPYLDSSLALYPDLEETLASDRPATQIFAEIFETKDLHSRDSLPLDVEMAVLRRLKRCVHLVLAIADISGEWTWEDITKRLTEFADLALTRLLRTMATELGLSGDADNPVPGLFILAMGKYGAGELNYSSDIDFNVFYDPDLLKLPDTRSAERTLIKLVQGIVRGCERITVDGYVFRTDLRLRPDPRSTSIAVSTHSAERYYESLGQNWERAAHIKARVACGDRQAGQAFLDHVISPFIWRKNLDFATIDDIMAMKRQMTIRAKSNDFIVAGHNLKLGLGGIREIEFYVQVQQLILGGRHQGLRAQRTCNALDRLSEDGFVSSEIALSLKHSYAKLRQWEHRIQMYKDEQSHILPVDDTQRLDIACLSGYDELAAFDRDVEAILRNVHAHYTALYPEAEPLSSPAGRLVFTGVEIDSETDKTLRRLGFEDPDQIWQSMSTWLGGRINATRTSRAREYLTNLAPRIIDACAQTGRPDHAFLAFRNFIVNLSAGLNTLSMFSQSPERLSEIIRLMTLSPLIAERISQQPATLDAMSDPNFKSIPETGWMDEFEADMTRCTDMEMAMNRARRRVREAQFRLVTSALSADMSQEKLAHLFTLTAEKSVRALCGFAQDNIEATLGPLEGSYAVIGLGKFGGSEMRLTSDLDIMTVYLPKNNDERSIRQFTRLTQRLVSALSSITEEGGLYEVDMALRPSGRSGPVAVSLPAFEGYYAKKAWTWEFMALSRARVIYASSSHFNQQITQALKTAMCCKRPDLDAEKDVADMLRRTRAEKKPRHGWDIKNLVGGLRDIEFIAQGGFVKQREAHLSDQGQTTKVMLDTGLALHQLTKTDHTELCEALDFYNMITQYLAMTQINPTQITEPVKRAITDLFKYDQVEDVERLMDMHTTHVSRLVNKYIFKS